MAARDGGVLDDQIAARRATDVEGARADHVDAPPVNDGNTVAAAGEALPGISRAPTGVVHRATTLRPLLGLVRVFCVA
jgi:hypothetical protein